MRLGRLEVDFAEMRYYDTMQAWKPLLFAVGLALLCAVLERALRRLAAAHPDRAGFVQSRGLRRYLSAMACAALVAGNSSSGVVETPTFMVPTVNIGRRQAGRAICANVLCCDADAPAIEAALRRALSPSFAPVSAGAVSPYNGGETSE